MTTPRRIEILGVPVDAVGMADTLAFADRHVAEGEGCATIVAVNPEKAMRARHDGSLLSLLRGATLLIPDGIGIVWAARVLGLGRFGRVPGSELMPNLCALAAGKGYSVFLYGARPEVNAAAVEALGRRFPGLRIAGCQHGYLAEDAKPELVRRINESGADMVFVALGSPAQEDWMAQYAPALQAKLCQGVGGTFDVLAGRVRRAPKLFLSLNLEWLYRLLREPSRIGRQLALLGFAWKVLLAKFG